MNNGFKKAHDKRYRVWVVPFGMKGRYKVFDTLTEAQRWVERALDQPADISYIGEIEEIDYT